MLSYIVSAVWRIIVSSGRALNLTLSFRNNLANLLINWDIKNLCSIKAPTLNSDELPTCHVPLNGVNELDCGQYFCPVTWAVLVVAPQSCGVIGERISTGELDDSWGWGGGGHGVTETTADLVPCVSSEACCGINETFEVNSVTIDTCLCKRPFISSLEVLSRSWINPESNFLPWIKCGRC